MVQNWQCSCHMPWHACSKHCMEPGRLRNDKGEKSRKTHATPKRALAEVCTEEGANMLDQAGRQLSNLSDAQDDIDLGPRQPKGRILPVLQQKYRRILQASPSIEGKAKEGETSREDRFGGGRPCVDPNTQARPEGASPANPSKQPDGSKGRGTLWRSAAPCNQSEADKPQEQAGKGRHQPQPRPAADMIGGSDDPS